MKPEEIFTRQEYNIFVNLFNLEYRRICDFLHKWPMFYKSDYEDVITDISIVSVKIGPLIGNINSYDDNYKFKKKFKKFKNTILRAELKDQEIVFNLEVMSKNR